MKNFKRIIFGFGIALSMVAVSGYGQEAVKVVEGYQINPPKPAKASKAAKAAKIGEPTVVVGYPIAITTTPAANLVTVEGFPLSVKDPISVKRHASLAFDNESKPSEVKIKMTEDYNFLQIGIYSSFRSGSVVVELIDPKGENRGKYNLKTEDLVVTGDKTNVEEEVIGEMKKEFNYPIEGEWVIRAVPAGAKGTINVMILQEYKHMNLRYEATEAFPSIEGAAAAPKHKKDN